jgi:hypothetical protein
MVAAFKPPDHFIPSRELPMFTVKEAVQVAMDLLNDLYDTRKFEDILLEAVELAEDGGHWLVTIGFSRKALSENVMEAIGSKKYIRSRKRFRIDADNGNLVSMKDDDSLR